MKYYIIAGEASGDLHASNLMRALSELDSSAQFRYIGGDLMKDAGGSMLRHYKSTAYMGVWPVITHLRTILSAGKECFYDIKAFQPDIVILVDYPGFNLSIAKMVKKAKLNARVFYYISPKLWAWKSYRIKTIKKYVDKMYSILPFEVEFFERFNYKIEYVGNPSVDSVYEYKQKNIPVIETKEPIIAILAGSRKQEITRNLPVMLDALKQYKGYRFILAGAPSIEPEFYQKVIKEFPVEVLFGKTYQILDSAYAALVTSGTAALETALFNVPQVVCYKMPLGRFVNFMRRFVIKCKYVTLVNLIDNSPIIPEIVSHVTKKLICKELTQLLEKDSEQRNRQLAGYERVHSALGEPGAARNTALRILSEISQK